MIEFEYLELNKRTHFKSQRFNLRKKGISLILGFNRKTKSSNGVGKSYFFGELPDILTGGESTGTRQDRVRKGSVRIGVKKGKTRYEFEQSFSPRETLKVFENGEDKGFRELKEARAFMEGVIPYSEQAVASFLYLDLANSAHPLITGTTAIRKAFFRDFFKQLDTIGPLRKLIDQEHQAVAQAGSRAAELEAELEGIGELEELDPVKARVEALQKERDDFSERLTQVTTATATYRRFTVVAQELGDTADLEELGESPKAEVKRLYKEIRARREKWDEYLDWISENEDLETDLKKVKRSLRALADSASGESEEEVQETYDKAVAEQDRFIRKRRSLQEKYSELGDDIKELKGSIAALSEKQGVCPTCGGDYHDKHLEERLGKLKAKLKDAQAERAGIKQELSELEEPSEEEIAKLKKKLTSVIEYFKLKRTYETLERRAASRPEEPKDSEKAIAKEEKRVEALRSRVDLYYDLVDLKNEWSSYPKEIRRLAKSGDLHAEFVRKNDELNEAKLKLQTLEHSWKTKDRLEEELQEKIAFSKRKKYLDILKQAFSPKGVEKEMISMACSMLEEQVNKFAKLVFSEDFRFYFEMESTFTISVERHYGKRVVVSDVRKLSGSEKRLFSLVLVVSLLSFVPPALRPNILILDEPTATMGEDNKSAFIRFLPVLNKVVPHLIVITPLKPHDFAHLEPDVYTVVRDGSSSTIVQGVVDANTELPNRA